jgi:hypothetical protein
LIGGVNVRKKLNFYVLILIVKHDLASRQVKSLCAKYLAFLLALQSFGKNLSLLHTFIGIMVEWERINGQW